MTSKAGHHGGGSQLYPNQGFVKIKTLGENVLSRLRALFQILNRIWFRWLLLFLFTMAFMLAHAHGEEQTGICKLMGPAIIWNLSSVVNFAETLGLCPCSSTEQLLMQRMNVCIHDVLLIVENRSPGPLGPPVSPFWAYAKVVMTVVAIIGGIGLAGWMLVYKRWHRTFTDADINMGLASEPAVPRQSNPTFQIHPHID